MIYAGRRPVDQYLRVTLERLYRALLIVTICAIVYFTLFPFDIQLASTRGIGAVVADLDVTVDEVWVYRDLPLNIVLFIPLGFGLAGRFSNRPDGRRPPVGLLLFSGLALSAFVEVLQSYTLMRFSAVPDIAANGVGCGVGIMAFAMVGDRPAVWLSRQMSRMRSMLDSRRLVFLYAVYLLVFVMASAWIGDRTSLANWEEDQPLVIGNETTGDRAWRGSILGFSLFDRSLSDDEVRALIDDRSNSVARGSVVAHHDFTSDAMGFPDLFWEAGEPAGASADGAELGGDRWLRSEDHVGDVIGAISRSSEFTVVLVAATDGLTQTGPARLISISDGLHRRNLTLGQDGTSLVLRVRTPLFGPDGTDPELVVRDVFNDHEFRRIVVRYDGSIIRVDVDSVLSETVELAPEVAMLLATFPKDIEWISVTPMSLLMFRASYRVLIFGPWAAYLAWGRPTGAMRRSTRGIASGILLATPALALEAALSFWIDPYRLRPNLVALNLIVIGIGWWTLSRGRRAAGR